MRELSEFLESAKAVKILVRNYCKNMGLNIEKRGVTKA